MTRPSYNCLHEFGAAMLGPMLCKYVEDLRQHSDSHTPVCLAREGWLIHQLLDSLQAQQLISLPQQAVYLKVSRTLLFRALLGEAELWPIALKNSYQGTVSSLLQQRFGLQGHEFQAFIPVKILDQAVSLPKDAGKIAGVLHKYSIKLKEQVAETRSAFTAYLDKLGLTHGKPPLFLDVGYSGTIQKLLTLLLKRDTSGLYFVTIESGTKSVGEFKANIDGTLKNNVKWREGCMLLDRSLFIECLMTAPHGQVIDIRQNQNGSFQFFYGQKAATQTYFQDLQIIHAGAIDAVSHALRHNITYTSDEIAEMYDVFSQSRHALPQEVHHLFSADDEICGNGLVNPIDLFAI